MRFMAESFGTEYTFVEVTTDDVPAKRQLWVAAAKPNQAITLVLAAVPEGWTAELAQGLTRTQLVGLDKLKVKPGDVRKLGK
jgi:hypothetical protein